MLTRHCEESGSQGEENRKAIRTEEIEKFLRGEERIEAREERRKGREVSVKEKLLAGGDKKQILNIRKERRMNTGEQRRAMKKEKVHCK